MIVVHLQLSRDEQNAEAHQNIELMPSLRAMMEQAEYLIDHDDFSGAEQELSKLIDVSNTAIEATA